MGITTIQELQTLRETWREEGLQVVLTNGVFDVLHIGHVSCLEQAGALGDVLVVGVNSDASTQAIKGSSRPLIPEYERACVLAALRCVNYVTIFEETTAEALVEALQPELYVKGGDYAVPERHGDNESDMEYVAHDKRIDEARVPECQVVRGYGGRVVLLPYHDGYSTSALIDRIKSKLLV